VIVVGLTGSIAMGKTETAKMFKELGVPVFDSDEYVGRLYEKGGAAVEAVRQVFPQAVINDAVERSILSNELTRRPDAFAALESIVHPLVRQGQRVFLDECRKRETPLAVLDIPLLFETGRQGEVDFIVVVSAPLHMQRDRALSRKGMTEKKFDMILARQVPDEEKRKLADMIIDTSRGLEAARRDVGALVGRLRRKASKSDA
jgi:dephospho-CoA kinase